MCTCMCCELGRNYLWEYMKNPHSWEKSEWDPLTANQNPLDFKAWAVRTWHWHKQAFLSIDVDANIVIIEQYSFHFWFLKFDDVFKFYCWIGICTVIHT